MTREKYELAGAYMYDIRSCEAMLEDMEDRNDLSFAGYYMNALITEKSLQTIRDIIINDIKVSLVNKMRELEKI